MNDGTLAAEALHAASGLAEEARIAEPAITRRLRALAGDNHGVMRGLRDQFKGLDSIKDKILFAVRLNGIPSQEAAALVNDALRYTMVLPADSLCGGVANTLHTLVVEGYIVEVPRNYWVDGNRYQGINVDIKAPTGQRFELQFHTPESYEAKTATHADYRILRDLSQPLSARIAAYDRMVAHCEALAAPRGVADIGTPVSHRRPT